MVSAFHIPSLEIYIPFNGCRCTDYKNLNTSQNQRLFLSFSRSQNASVSHFGPVTDRKDRFPYIFVYCNWWNPYPFMNLKPGKRYPFRSEPPHHEAIIGSSPPPPPSENTVTREKQWSYWWPFPASIFLKNINTNDPKFIPTILR